VIEIKATGKKAKTLDHLMFYLLQKKGDGFCESDFINIINGGFVNPCTPLAHPPFFPFFPDGLGDPLFTAS
jgi:hypothetical protein